MADYKILIVNPNTTKSMTDALKPIVESLGYANTTYTFWTAPTGPSSINNHEDCVRSANECFPFLQPLIDSYDAFLIACYSHHPLVALMMRHASRKPVLGIFEASITTATQLLTNDTNANQKETFGIVTTGKVWEKLLGEAVLWTLGGSPGTPNSTFAGVQSTGLNATELHDAPQVEVKQRVQDAAKRLTAAGDVKVVILGCAGMAGMDEWIREVVPETVRIVDGVKAGVGALQTLLRAQF